MDLIKSIIKWIIIVFLIVFLIYLISRLGTSGDTNTNNKKNLKPVTTIKEKTDHTLDSLVPEEEYNNNNNTTQVVEVQNTASSGELALIIGSFIISVGTFYIYKHEN